MFRTDIFGIESIEDLPDGASPIENFAALVKHEIAIMEGGDLRFDIYVRPPLDAFPDVALDEGRFVVAANHARKAGSERRPVAYVAYATLVERLSADHVHAAVLATKMLAEDQILYIYVAENCRVGHADDLPRVLGDFEIVGVAGTLVGCTDGSPRERNQGVYADRPDTPREMHEDDPVPEWMPEHEYNRRPGGFKETLENQLRLDAIYRASKGNWEKFTKEATKAGYGHRLHALKRAHGQARDERAQMPPADRVDQTDVTEAIRLAKHLASQEYLGDKRTRAWLLSKLEAITTPDEHVNDLLARLRDDLP